MMVERGSAQTLKEVAEKFIEFAQKSDAKTQAWEKLDDRLSSFYGATLKVNVNKHEVNGKKPCFFVSLQHSEINSMSYYEFVYNTPENYHSELYERYPGEYSRGKYGGNNPFRNTGEFVAFGLHTVYDENLWMCEQGQVTCEEEATAQINHMNLVTDFSIINSIYTRITLKPFVVYPGMGCPWLCVSDDNKKQLVTSLHGIQYWFTKTDYAATITIKLDGRGVVPSRWQSIALGAFECVDDMSYDYPLYVCGGSGGLHSDLYSFYYPRQDFKTPHYGNYLDLSIDNPCLSNSYALYPVKFNGSETSNFKILAPEGIWRNIFGYEQNAQVLEYPYCTRFDDYGYGLTAPVDYIDKHSALPFLSSHESMIDTYAVKEGWNKIKYSTPVYDVMLVLNHNIDHQERGVIGRLPNVFYNFSRSMPEGEIELNGKKWLSIPNGWEGRQKVYETHVGWFYDWDIDAAQKKYEDLTNPLKHNMFVHKMLIPLEEF